MEERFTWAIADKAGQTTLEGDGCHFSALAEVHELALIPRDQADIFVGIVVPEGKVPVFFRRRMLVLNGEGDQTFATCIGWHEPESPDGLYLFILNDQSIVITELPTHALA